MLVTPLPITQLFIMNSSTTISLDIPIACTLSERALAERLQGPLADLFSQAEAQRGLADGFAFKFAGDAETAVSLFNFIQKERDCCAFFTFDLTFEPNHGPIWLSLRGGEGVKEFVANELVLGNN